MVPSITSLEKGRVISLFLVHFHTKFLSGSWPVACQIWSPRLMDNLKEENNNSEKFFKHDVDENLIFFFALEELVVYVLYFQFFCRFYHARHENDTVLNDEILAIFPESSIWWMKYLFSQYLHKINPWFKILFRNKVSKSRVRPKF